MLQRLLWLSAFAMTTAAATAQARQAQDPSGEQVPQALAESVGAEDDAPKAELYKMLGVLQFAQGKVAEATASLKMALRLDPQLTLAARDTVDEKVLSLFATLGGRVVSEVVQAEKPGPVPADPVLDARSAEEAMMLAAAAEVAKDAAAKRKLTSIQIESNVPGAQVYIDDIRVGAVGDEIDVQPGELVVEVGAPGYEPEMKVFYAVKDEKTVRKVVLAPEQPAH